MPGGRDSHPDHGGGRQQAAQGGGEVPSGMPAAQGGHVGGLGGVHEIAGREDQRRRRLQRGVHRGPFSTRVLRRRPSRSFGGSGLARASRISPRVTRSQWQTIAP